MLLTVTCLLACALHAEEQFRAGYLITLQQDTLYGQIGLHASKRNATSCSYRATGGDTVKVYFPTDIAGYGISNPSRCYLSKTIELPEEGKKQVFLEQLPGRGHNLYYYESAEGNPLFFSQVGGSLVPLDREGYLAILHLLFKGCPRISLLIDNSPYTRGSFAMIARNHERAMNGAAEDCMTLEAIEAHYNSIPQPAWRYTFYAGVIHFPTHSEGSVRHTSNAGFQAGILLSRSNLGRSKILHFDFDFSFAKASGHTTYSYSGGGGNNNWYDQTTNKENITLFSAKGGLRLAPDRGAARPFVGLGVDLRHRVEDSGSRMYGGYYIDAGVNFQPGKNPNLLMLRARFGHTRKGFSGKERQQSIDAAIGYSF